MACMSSFVPNAITLFELQTSDFAWKFIWTIPKKMASMQRKICMESTWTMELAITQQFFELDMELSITQDFAWNFYGPS